jgi:S-adenosylmethionine:tRNA ribosyltransferase-isomerase
VKAGTGRRPRSRDARLLVVDESGVISSRTHRELPVLLPTGSLLIANDAATLPASLAGVFVPTGEPIEVRLAGWSEVESRFMAVVFGAGDYRTRTEDRPLPPALYAGDDLLIASRRARIVRTHGHPRLIEIEFEDPPAVMWEALTRNGRPIQYAHLQRPLALWDTWTSIAAGPAAFEAPSAGFILDWSMLTELRRRGVRFATLTHAAGISSTGDPALDARLPFDEPYRIPPSTARLIERTRAEGGRIIALGTTVVRALEHAARATGHVVAGNGLATGRIGARTPLRIADAILSGMHEPGTSHYDLLRAFHTDTVIARMWEEAEKLDYVTHEFGDAVLIMRQVRVAPLWRRTGRGERDTETTAGSGPAAPQVDPRQSPSAR